MNDFTMNPSQKSTTVVRCTSNKEKQAVIDYTRARDKKNNYTATDTVGPFIVLDGLLSGCHNPSGFGYKVISFTEFEVEELGINLDGRYLKALVDKPQSIPIYKGQFVQINKGEFLYPINGKDKDGYVYSVGKIGEVWELMPPSFLANTSKPTEILLEAAKRKFPVGTKFKSPQDYKIYTVKAFPSSYGGINWLESTYYTSDNTKDTTVLCGNNETGYGQYLYFDGKWAEVISTEKPIESAPEYVECIKEATLWLKVGRIYKTLVNVNDHFCWYHHEDNKPPHTSQKYDSYGESWLKPGNINQTVFKPSTKEDYDAQFLPTTHPRNLTSKQVIDEYGVVFNENDRSKKFNDDLVTAMSYYTSELISGIVKPEKFSWNILDRTKPSSKISVKSHEEFKITVNKPKTIKL